MVYLPKAQVTLQPVQEERGVEQQIILSAQAKEPDFVKSQLPIRIVESAAASEKTFTRGSGQEKEGLASGTVKLVNERGEEMELLPKSHLRHAETGVFFLTDKPARIPANGEITMPVTAKEPGVKGNVGPGRLLIEKLPATVQEVIYAESSQAFSGGIVVEEPLSELELNQAKDEVLQAAKEKAARELPLKAGGAFIREDLITFADEKTEASAAAGSKTNIYSVTAEAKARTAIVDDNDLLSLTLLKLRAAAGPEEEFINYDPQSFELDFVKTDFERGEIVVKGKLKGTFAKKIPATAFSGRMLAGLTLKEAQAALRDVPGVGEAKVELSPFWVTSVPGRPEAIEIVIGNNE